MKHLYYGSVNSKHADPHPPAPNGHLSGICHLVGPSCKEFVRKPLPGVGHSSILLEVLNIVPTSIFTKKYVYLDKQDNTLLVYSLSKDFSWPQGDV